MKEIRGVEKELINSPKNPEIALNELFANIPASEICFSSSFGIEDQVISYFLSKISTKPYIFTLDTGRLFPEIYDLQDKTEKKYSLEIDTIHPDANRLKELTRRQGQNGFYQSVEARKSCCEVRKIDGLKKGIAGKTVWITGLRKDQSPNRASMNSLEWDDKNKIYKFHPLFFWTYQDCIEFADKLNIPINPLHKKGFVSIGCQPCTRAIQEGEDFRAGRWWWESSKKECGLHQ